MFDICWANSCNKIAKQFYAAHVMDKGKDHVCCWKPVLSMDLKSYLKTEFLHFCVIFKPYWGAAKSCIWIMRTQHADSCPVFPRAGRFFSLRRSSPCLARPFLAGACSMAIGEFISVCSQRDVELAQLDRDGKRGGEEEKALLSPVQAAVASALAFSVGALVPLLAAGFVRDYRLRIGVVIALATATLAAFGCVGACWAAPPSQGPARGW
ncbi:hypothetical protein SEVIR_3G316403v4 [Setaria viridis]|uniref:Vacuolar iron transporter n=1 Tax=Setaria viridis TaxID=4556 RepID=A0A4V6DA28_SETVI|nr:hypothetical protein SEVIR_3G316403v2 [Setaria viridis]